MEPWRIARHTEILWHASLPGPSVTFPLALWCAIRGEGEEPSSSGSPRHERTPIALSAAEDPAVVTAVRAGDGAAFDTLVVAYWAPLCTFATGYVKDAERAKELVADVFAAVWERRATWHVTTTIETYLFGAVRNRARTAHRDTVRRANILRLAAQREEFVAMATPTATDLDVERADVMHHLDRAVCALPERLQEVTRLRWEHQLDYDAIAAILHVSPAAARQLASRALKLLREALVE